MRTPPHASRIFYRGQEEMVQSVKHLSHEHRELGLIPAHVKIMGMVRSYGRIGRWEEERDCPWVSPAMA